MLLSLALWTVWHSVLYLSHEARDYLTLAAAWGS